MIGQFKRGGLVEGPGLGPDEVAARLSPPRPILGFDPYKAPGWVQPYLDCVDGIAAHGLGDGTRRVRVEMFRGGRLVGEVITRVPDNAG
jgi:hypothetical protein